MISLSTSLNSLLQFEEVGITGHVAGHLCKFHSVVLPIFSTITTDQDLVSAMPVKKIGFVIIPSGERSDLH